MLSQKTSSLLAVLCLGVASSFKVNPHSSATPRLFRSDLHVATPVDTTNEAKDVLIELVKAGEDENSPNLIPYLDILKQSYSESKIDARHSENPAYNGDWDNVNTPAFQGRLGFTEQGLPMYTIGRLTFNLIPPAKDVVCAVEKMVQHVHPVQTNEIPLESQVPEPLRQTWMQFPDELRTNKIDTLFEIPGSTVRGILRMEGHTLPNAHHENRYDTWFLGGRCMPQEGVDHEEWIKVFGTEQRPEDMLHYTLSSPMVAYQTVVYLDDSLRVSVGNRGTVMMNVRQA
ncbi:hypothetical protein ACA910_016861 [Epithemia clementina (nom. ined.)]